MENNLYPINDRKRAQKVENLLIASTVAIIVFITAVVLLYFSDFMVFALLFACLLLGGIAFDHNNRTLKVPSELVMNLISAGQKNEKLRNTILDILKQSDFIILNELVQIKREIKKELDAYQSQYLKEMVNISDKVAIKLKEDTADQHVHVLKENIEVLTAIISTLTITITKKNPRNA